MSVSKKTGKLFMILGTMLLLLALSLFLWNRAEDRRAGKQAEAVLDELKEKMVSGKSLEESIVDSQNRAETNSFCSDGYEYMGYLSIPALELELPVMAEWDYPRLRIAPCREFGSPQKDDLVIAAHNYNSHFGRLHTLKSGDTVSFTEMDGTVHSYQVEDCRILQPDQAEEVLLSSSELVLYTCTKGGATRVVVYCSRV